jgi:hypothetical protein
MSSRVSLKQLYTDRGDSQSQENCQLGPYEASISLPRGVARPQTKLEPAGSPSAVSRGWRFLRFRATFGVEDVDALGVLCVDELSFLILELFGVLPAPPALPERPPLPVLFIRTSFFGLLTRYRTVLDCTSSDVSPDDAEPVSSTHSCDESAGNGNGNGNGNGPPARLPLVLALVDAAPYS